MIRLMLSDAFESYPMDMLVKATQSFSPPTIVDGGEEREIVWEYLLYAASPIYIEIFIEIYTNRIFRRITYHPL